MKYTPGPWKPVSKDYYTTSYFMSGDKYVLSATPLARDDEEKEGNVYLASLAPEMLELMRALVEKLDDLDISLPSVTAFRADKILEEFPEVLE